MGGGGGGADAVPFRPIQSVGGGGGAYMLTFIIRVPFSPKGGGGGGGGGHGPPAPTLGTPMTGSAGLAYLVGALQALPMVLM